MNFATLQQAIRGLGYELSRDVVCISLGEKILRLWEDGHAAAAWPISYSRLPPSCVENSLGTPWGLHQVAEKYGAGAAPGTVFIGRRNTGQRWQDRPDAGPNQPALVTTRILRLRGLQPGLNAGPGVDSFNRFIYIHGTNFPSRFPENLSAGCILMQDDDLIQLYDRLPVGALVQIVRKTD